jgi:hypothetical protein
MTTKTWWLSTCEINPNDYQFLIGLEIRVHVDQPTHTFETIIGKSVTVAGKPRIEFTTTTEKQEVMLKLKYGSDLLLTHEAQAL